MFEAVTTAALCVCVRGRECDRQTVEEEETPPCSTLQAVKPELDSPLLPRLLWMPLVSC